MTRYESDSRKASAGYGATKRDLQLVFFDGQVPGEATAATRGVRAQTADTLERVAAAAARSGLGQDDILRTTVYLTDLDRSRAVDDAFDEFFDRRRPAKTVVGVDSLPGGAAVQVEATGVKR